MADSEMEQSVFTVLEAEFLKPKDREPLNLAASYIALEHLRDAWKVLEKHKDKPETGKPLVQRAL